ncbi:DUF4240 domain-containing protein [Dactylosporangium darangshiense]
MNADGFWDLIERSAVAGPYVWQRGDWLEERMHELSDIELHHFQDLADHYRGLADDERVYHAAVILGGGACGDSGFDGFRGWLVSLGRERFGWVLEDPDRLADLPEIARLAGRDPRHWDEDEPHWEEIEYLGLQEMEDRPGECGHDGSEPEYPDDIPQRHRDYGQLPRLTAMFAYLQARP